jgi:glycerol kinase
MTMNTETVNRPRAIALDLGSTRFKLGALDANGRLEVVHSVPAPRLTGDGLSKYGDPEEFLDTAGRLLDMVAERWPDRSPDGSPGLPLGLVCQRSTFTAWDKTTGKPLVPMISWQDRRAADWCAEHSAEEALVVARTGLPLSPHYVGPKVAALQAGNPELSDALQKGNVLIGTLDAWLIWHWSHASNCQTDLTMAARTAMVDITQGDWSEELLDLYRIPRSALPDLTSTDGHAVVLSDNLRLAASIADQASSALSVLDPKENVALVNFGTGAFVLYPATDGRVRRRGYLTAPIFLGADRETRFVLEGTINGAGPALDRFASGPTELPAADACTDGFAIPDQTGLGSPYWRPELGLILSAAARGLSPSGKRRIVLEGLLFRVLEILLDLGQGTLPDRVLISGGLVQDPAVGSGLASLLRRPVERLDISETTLLGAARLAAGLNPLADPKTHCIDASDAGAYLCDKFPRWQHWLTDQIG